MQSSAIPRPLSRRHFLWGAGMLSTGLLAACGQLSLPTRAPSRSRTIGFLGPFLPAHASGGLSISDEILRDGLREQGYTDGQNLAIEWRRSTSSEEYGDLAAELVGSRVDAIVA